MKEVIDVLSCKCPKCKKENIFNNRGNILLLKMPKMNDRCVACNYKFEKEPGFFFGSMFVSYALGAGQMIISLIIFWHFLDLSPLNVFFITAITLVLLSTVNFRISRSIWIYLFYKD